MTERAPYLVLRDFRVWFQRRAGFLASLAKSEYETVRAVDGVDLDIGKGEIFCLVGESGCGKTTTGKGILRLVEPTGGDVFVGLKPSDLTAYEEARAKGDRDALEDFRQQHSITYKEQIERHPIDFVLNAIYAAAGTLMAAFLTLGIVLGLESLRAGTAALLFYILLMIGGGAAAVALEVKYVLPPPSPSPVGGRRFLSQATRSAIRTVGIFALLLAIALLGLCALAVDAATTVAFATTGLAVSFFGTLPFVKLSKGLTRFLGVCAILATLSAHLLIAVSSVAARGDAINAGSVLGQYVAVWESNAFALAFLQYIFAFVAAAYGVHVFIDFWRHRHGYEADRLGKLRKTLQIIFQDPYESLNPRHTVYDIVSEPLVVNRLARSRSETEARVAKALHDSGLRPPKDFMFRFPHELSGGQRQRVSIAGALVLEPDFIVADEPVSMLDVSIRTEILELLLELRKERGLTYLFITHDLSLAWVIADRIGVMYLGKIVEQAPTREIIQHPRHPYTQALISVVPVPDPDLKHDRIILTGERPDPTDIPAGCRFHPRCPAAFERCGWTSDEVLGTLRELAHDGSAMDVQALTPAGPLKLTWSPPPGGAETWLRKLMATRADDHRSLKAIRSIEGAGSNLDILLHDYQEPTLRSVAPDVLVACLLYE
jgi:oligopeptide/dipeptide ABC transporter ATP-binding protein